MTISLLNGQATIQTQGALPGGTREGMSKGKYFPRMIPYKDVLDRSNVSKTRCKGHQSQPNDSY